MDNVRNTNGMSIAEYAAENPPAPNPDPNGTDDGPTQLDNIEGKLDELLEFKRALVDILEAASANPMLAMMVPGGIPKIG